MPHVPQDTWGGLKEKQSRRLRKEQKNKQEWQEKMGDHSLEVHTQPVAAGQLQARVACKSNPCGWRPEALVQLPEIVK